MKITVRMLNIMTITIIAFFALTIFTGDVEAAPKKLSKPSITVVKIDKTTTPTKAYNRICMSDTYEANNVQIYRKVNNGKWRLLKTVKHYNGKYIGGKYVIYTDTITKYTKNYNYRYRVKCNGNGFSRSKKYTKYSDTKNSTIGKRSFIVYLKNGATNKNYKSTYVRYGSSYTAPASGPAVTGYKFTGWTTKKLTNIRKSYTITAKYSRLTYKATFYKPDGSVLNTYTRNYGAKLSTLPSGPAKSGYTFTGWTCNGQGVTSNTVVKSNMTIKPNYKVLAIPATFKYKLDTYENDCSMWNKGNYNYFSIYFQQTGSYAEFKSYMLTYLTSGTLTFGNATPYYVKNFFIKNGVTNYESYCTGSASLAKDVDDYGFANDFGCYIVTIKTPCGWSDVSLKWKGNVVYSKIGATDSTMVFTNHETNKQDAVYFQMFKDKPEVWNTMYSNQCTKIKAWIEKKCGIPNNQKRVSWMIRYVTENVANGASTKPQYINNVRNITGGNIYPNQFRWAGINPYDSSNSSMKFMILAKLESTNCANTDNMLIDLDKDMGYNILKESHYTIIRPDGDEWHTFYYKDGSEFIPSTTILPECNGNTIINVSPSYGNAGNIINENPEVFQFARENFWGH